LTMLHLCYRLNRNILNLLHKNLKVELILGNTSLTQKSEQKSIDSFDSLSELASKNPAGHLRVGHLNKLKKKLDLTIAGFEKILAKNPRLINVFGNIILLHAAKNEYETALAKCDKQIEKLGGEPELLANIYNIKGGLYIARNNKDMAKKAFEKAISIYPDFLKPYYALARLYLADKDLDNAILQYQLLLDKNPKQTGPHMLLGILYNMKKEYKFSEKYYREALLIDPDLSQAANNLAYLLAEYSGNLDEALHFALKAKSENKDDPFIRDTVGWVYYKMGLYDDAIRELEFSADKIPDNVTANYHLGMAYFKKGNKKSAKEKLKKALSLDNNFFQAGEAKKVLLELNRT